ncbi:FxLD family lanthipeptide [Streptomyces diastatochromogenes]|nr:FxLD family lanthipeptide [Streptomyces diastatochromogenes]
MTSARAQPDAFDLDVQVVIGVPVTDAHGNSDGGCGATSASSCTPPA